MWVILHTADDASSIWAYEGLKARGLAPLHLIDSETLAHSLNWEHRLNNNGLKVRIETANGLSLHSEQLSGVLNRLSWISDVHTVQARAADHLYATQEWSAFYISWLHSLPVPTLNRASAHGLSGPWYRTSEWLWLAEQIDLPTISYCYNSEDLTTGADLLLHKPEEPLMTVLVIGEQVIGQNIPAAVQSGCLRLAKQVDVSVLGVSFTPDWLFHDATTLPDLRQGGAQVLDALYTELKKGA